MTDERVPRRSQPDAPEDAGGPNDIEITEIQGLPADAPPPAGADEAVQGEDASGVSEAGAAGGLAAAAADPEDLQRQIEALREDYLRARADFENYRKRQQRERSEFARHAAAALVEHLLPVLDNFERALEAAPDGEDEDDRFREGVRMIHRQLSTVLAEQGLTRIDSQGKPFDPNLHEAVAREETSEVEANTVIEELEPGYRFRDRLLRAAKVRVAVAPTDG